VDEVFPQKAPTGRLHCSPGRQPAAGRPALGGRRSRTPSFFFSPEPRKGRLNLNRPDGAQSKKGKWWLGRIPRACARGYITVRPSGAQKKGGWQEKGGKGNILLFAPRRDRPATAFPSPAEPACRQAGPRKSVPLFCRSLSTPHSPLRAPHWASPPARHSLRRRRVRKAFPVAFHSTLHTPHSALGLPHLPPVTQSLCCSVIGHCCLTGHWVPGHWSFCLSQAVPLNRLTFWRFS